MVERARGTSGQTTLIKPKKEKAAEVVKIQLKPRNNVQWAEDTVDNEGLNKRKSKVCCIYEKPRTHPGTSSESSCSDSDCGNNYDRLPRH